LFRASGFSLWQMNTPVDSVPLFPSRFRYVCKLTPRPFCPQTVSISCSLAVVFATFLPKSCASRCVLPPVAKLYVSATAPFPPSSIGALFCLLRQLPLQVPPCPRFCGPYPAFICRRLLSLPLHVSLSKFSSGRISIQGLWFFFIVWWD